MITSNKPIWKKNDVLILTKNTDICVNFIEFSDKNCSCFLATLLDSTLAQNPHLERRIYLLNTKDYIKRIEIKPELMDINDFL